MAGKWSDKNNKILITIVGQTMFDNSKFNRIEYNLKRTVKKDKISLTSGLA